MECYICGSNRIKKFGDYDNSKTFESKLILNLYRCLVCKTVFLHPRQSNFCGRDHFAMAYRGSNNNLYYNDDYKMKVGKIRLDYLRNNLVFNSILDVGCGKGFFLKEASNNGIRVCGVEVSEPAFEFACGLIGKNAMRKRIEDVIDKYDVVVLWDVIEHIENPCALLKELSKRLSTKGHLILRTGNIDSLNFILYPKNHWIIFADHKFYFSPISINYCLDKSGYNVKHLLDLHYLEKHLLEHGAKEVLEKEDVYRLILKILQKPEKIFNKSNAFLHILKRKYFEFLLGPTSHVDIMTVIAQLK